MKYLLLILSISASTLISSCHLNEEHHQGAENTFKVTSPLIMDTSFTKEYVCQIRSINHIELRALERGYLQEIFVDEGQFIKKGQLMFQIMPMLYEAEMKMAQAEVNFAKIEYQNSKRLVDSNIVSPNELAMLAAKLDKAEAELALKKVHLDFTQIHAPFSGIMDRFEVRLGSLVDEGELLTSLSDNTKLWVYFNVSEAEYLDYMQQVHSDSLTKVKLLMANNKIFDYEGVVETIEADFNNETGNIPFRATFPNPKGLLRHGETGSILMTIPLNDALLIPQKATFEVLDKKYVYVLDEENRVQSRLIKIQQELPHLFAVESGLDKNDKILLEGISLVRENEEVKAEFISPESAFSDLELYAE